MKLALLAAGLALVVAVTVALGRAECRQPGPRIGGVILIYGC